MKKLIQILEATDVIGKNTVNAAREQYKKSLKEGKPQIAPLSAIIKSQTVGNVAFTKGSEAIKELIGEKKAIDLLNQPDKDEFIKTMGVLTSSVVLMIPKSDANATPIIATRDIDLLEKLFSAKKLIGKDGAFKREAFDKQLSGMKAAGTQNGALEGKTTVIKLEAIFADNSVKFTTTRTQSCFDLNDYVIFPLLHIVAYGEELAKFITENKYVRVTKKTEVGDKTHVFTMSKEALIEVYEKAGIKNAKEKVEQKISGRKVGYNILNNRVFGYDAESSIYIEGIASARPERVIKIEPISIEAIDKSMLNIDLSKIRSIFDKKIMNANKAELSALTGYLTLEPGAKYKVGEIKEKLIIWGNEQDSTALYKLMKSLGDSTDENSQKVFNDVDKRIDSYAKQQPKATKEYVPVALDESMTLADKVAYLKERAKTRVLKIKITKKDGTVGTIIGTNNPKILAKMWGKDYVAKFETPIVRLKAARVEIESGADIGTTLVKYDIISYLTATGLMNTQSDGSGIVPMLNKDTVIPAINAAINKLAIDNTSKGVREDIFKIKRLPIDNERMRAVASIASMKSNGLYRDINVNSILSVEESRYEQK